MPDIALALQSTILRESGVEATVAVVCQGTRDLEISRRQEVYIHQLCPVQPGWRRLQRCWAFRSPAVCQCNTRTEGHDRWRQ